MSRVLEALDRAVRSQDSTRDCQADAALLSELRDVLAGTTPTALQQGAAFLRVAGESCGDATYGEVAEGDSYCDDADRLMRLARLLTGPPQEEP